MPDPPPPPAERALRTSSGRQRIATDGAAWARGKGHFRRSIIRPWHAA